MPAQRDRERKPVRTGETHHEFAARRMYLKSLPFRNSADWSKIHSFVQDLSFSLSPPLSLAQDKMVGKSWRSRFFFFINYDFSFFVLVHSILQPQGQEPTSVSFLLWLNILIKLRGETAIRALNGRLPPHDNIIFDTISRAKLSIGR